MGRKKIESSTEKEEKAIVHGTAEVLQPKKYDSAVKRLVKKFASNKDGILFTSGRQDNGPTFICGGFGANAWFVRLDGPWQALLPEAVEVRGGLVKLVGDANGFNLGEQKDANDLKNRIEGLNRISKDSIESRSSSQKRIHPEKIDNKHVLVQTTEDEIYSLALEVDEDSGQTVKRVYLNRKYVDAILSLAGFDNLAHAEFNVKIEAIDDVSPVVFRISEGFDAVVMPMRL